MVEFDFISNIIGHNSEYLIKKKRLFTLEESQHKTGKDIIHTVVIDEENITNLMVYKFDDKDGNIHFPFFSEKNEPSGLRSLCDYILICSCKKPNKKEKFYVVLLEMKACESKNRSSNKKKAKAQLEAADCLIRYIFETANRIKTETDNITKYSGVDKIHLSNSNIVKCVLMADTNPCALTNSRSLENVEENSYEDDKYHICTCPGINGIFQLHKILK